LSIVRTYPIKSRKPQTACPEQIVSDQWGMVSVIGMNKTHIKYPVLAALILFCFAIAACAQDATKAPSSDPERLTALETEVKALKLEATAREAAFKKELGLIRKNLEGIRALMEVEKGRADALDSPKEEPQTEGDKLDDALNNKAKSFVNENLDRLLEITKKLLDKMEQELDKQTEEPETKPDGNEI